MASVQAHGLNVFQAVGWLPETAQSLAEVGAFVARHIPAVRAAESRTVDDVSVAVVS